MLVGLHTPCICMLAIFDHMVDNSPISIEKKYVDANGDRDPHRIPVKHNHLEDSSVTDGWGGGRRSMHAWAGAKLNKHVIITKNT